MLQIGSLCWAVIPDDGKLLARPCVITACSPYPQHQHVVEVVYGQDHPPQHAQKAAVPPIRVEKTSQLGKALGLAKTTYFFSRKEIYLSTIERHCVALCPVLDQLALEALAETQR